MATSSQATNLLVLVFLYMMRIFRTIIFTIAITHIGFASIAQQSYQNYHHQIVQSEQLIVSGNYEAAILKLDSLFTKYNFVFLRDCKLATELCAYTKDLDHGLRFVQQGILQGWTLKDIEKNKNLRFLLTDPRWAALKNEYEELHRQYLKKLNIPLREQVHLMFKNDQRKALGALFRIGEKSQQKYAERKFAPHSEKQIREINIIIDSLGYPGEQIIGNKLWASVILSHHNSISPQYNSSDTLYTFLKPKLLQAISRGELSPYVLTTIEDWRTAAISNHNLTTYGYLGKISDTPALDIVNNNRSELGIRSIELRNSLIDIEQETGMNLYLKKDWQKGKISIVE